MDPQQLRELKPFLLVGLIALMALGVVIAVKIGNRRDAQRVKALASIATELGMTFQPENSAILREFGGYAFYQHGDVPRATSVMHGMSGDVPLLLFDYAVTLGSRNNRSTLRRTVAAFDMSASPLPVFDATGSRDGAFTRMVDRALGEPGIDFADDAEFARVFHVAGADAIAVRRVFNINARLFLMRRSDWMCRSTGRWLLLCWLKEQPAPEGYQAFVAEVSEAMTLMTGARV